ncbi:MAG: DMT family transporter [Actinobacteria bacterium]|nr:DMT family transporter [Actinomycetota bacterium]
MGALLALASSIMWGAGDFVGGMTSRRRPALAVYLGSQVFGFLGLIVAATMTGVWGTAPTYVPWAIAGSIAGVIGMYAFYQALSIGPMGIVSPLVALAVVIPVTFGLITGETPSSMQGLGILAAIVGVLLASGPELSGAESGKPLGYAAVALVFFGVMFITIAEGSKTSALMTMTGMRAMSMVLILVAVLVFRSKGGITPRDWPVLAFIGLLDAAANVTFGVATTLDLLSTTAVLGSLYPVVTAILAAVVLKERLRPVQYAGVVVTMLGVFLVSAGA